MSTARSTSPGNVLFASHSEAGHLNPLLSVAARLRARGHHCVFAGFGSSSTLDCVAGSGFTLERLPAPISSLGFRLLPCLRGIPEIALATELFTSQPGTYARTLLPVLRRFHPQVVVSDFLLPGAGIAADICHLPWISIYHAGLDYPGPGIPPIGCGLEIGAPEGWHVRFLKWLSRLNHERLHRRLRHARRSFGLELEASPAAFWTSPWATLLLTAAEAEAPRDPLPVGTFFIGPCIDGRPTTGVDEFPYHLLSEERRRIYISMGTVFNRQPRVFQRILQSLASTPYQLIVSAGASWGALRHLHRPPDILIMRRVPQLELLRRVDVVVTHGGNNTIAEALSAGKPLVVLPQGGEQESNASRIVYLGVGRKGGHDPQRLRDIVTQVVESPTYRNAAERVATILAQTDGAGIVADFVTRLMEAPLPITRPDDYPLTITPHLPMPWERSGTVD